MSIDIFFKITDSLLQLIMVIIAGFALFSWKKETRGKERYNFAKDLLNYTQKIKFLIHSKGKSWHQIYINDIIADRENFYTQQLSMIKHEKIIFDQSVFGLFNHINIRSDIFLPKQIRIILEDLYPRGGEIIAEKVDEKKQFTYIELGGIEKSNVFNMDNNQDNTNFLYQMHGTERMSLEEYFRKWEKLVLELQKYL